MKIEVLPITTIKEYENNAKLHPREQIEQIKKSIQEFGNNDPIAIDENNVIIEGHGRYMALKELGFCAIGDGTVNGVPYAKIIDIAREYIERAGGFEKLAEWGLF